MEIYSQLELPKTVIRSMSHSSELDCEEGEWQDSDYNYRLNSCDDIFYAIIDNEVVGHVGLKEATIQALYVNPKFSGKGFSYALYNYVFKIFPIVYSDTAREPGAEHMWIKMMSKNPSNIRFDKKLDQYIYTSNEYNR